MPGFIGKKLCPSLVIVTTNFDKYREVSKQVREILAEYDPNFCPMSLDEAYFDLTDHLEKRKCYTKAQRTFVEGAPSKEETKEDERCTEINCNGDESTQVNEDGVKDSESLESNADKATLDLNEERDQPESSPEEKRTTKEVKSVTFGMSVEDTVEEIRFRIHQRSHLTASAGKSTA